MRLLFDQKLSHKLVERLADAFPESRHARDIGMKSATDPEIARYALSEGFTFGLDEPRGAFFHLLDGREERILAMALTGTSSA